MLPVCSGSVMLRCSSYFAPVFVICLFVCPSVCPLVYLKNHTVEPNQIFRACCLWPVLGPPDGVAISYVLPVL